MKRKKLIATALMVAVFIITSSVQMVEADLVWADNDFEVGWQLNEAMQVTDDSLRWNGQSLGGEYGRAFHNSSVNVGTWKFDLIEFDSSPFVPTAVHFIANVDRERIEPSATCYLVLERYAGDYTQYRLLESFSWPSQFEELARYNSPAMDPTTHHIKITREASNGQINVHVNGSLVMQVDGSMPSLDPYGPESVFLFYTERDVALDNVEVNDIPEPPPIPMELVVVAVGGTVVAVVVIALIVKRRE